MSRWKSGAQPLAVLGLLLLLGPQLGELDHQAEHSRGLGLIHNEALHPDAAVHLEQEEHDRLDDCLACIHGAEKAAPSLGVSGTLAASAAVPVAESNRVTFSVAWSTHPPRAPPV